MKSETRYMMWYYIGHVLTFFQITILTIIMLCVGLGVLLLGGSFIMWQWPDWSRFMAEIYFILRLFSIMGTFAGFLYVFSGYAHQNARDLAYRRTAKK